VKDLSYANVQQAFAVEDGYGGQNGGSEISLAHYPNAKFRPSYKHGGVANPQGAGGTGAGTTIRNTSNSLFTKQDLLNNPTWIATKDGNYGSPPPNPVTNGGAGNGFAGCLIPDVGYAPYVSASVTEIVRYATYACTPANNGNGSGFNTIFFDNVSGGIFLMMDQYPWNRAAGRLYTSIEWRNAIVAYYCALADALKGVTASDGKQVMTILNASDYYDTSAGDAGPISYGDTTSLRRMWKQITDYVANTGSIVNKDAVDWLFWEFFCQATPGGLLTKRVQGNTDPNWFWDQFQGMVAYAHSLNRHFAYTATMDNTNVAGDSANATYERVSYLLDYDGLPDSKGRTDILWMWNVVPPENLSFNNSNFYSNPGAPASGAAGTHQVTNGLHWRQFANFLAVCNPTQATIGAQTINGKSVPSLASGKAVLVP